MKIKDLQNLKIPKIINKPIGLVDKINYGGDIYKDFEKHFNWAIVIVLVAVSSLILSIVFQFYDPKYNDLQKRTDSLEKRVEELEKQ